MNLLLKKVGNVILMLSGLILFGFIAYIGFKNLNLGLNDFHRLETTITAIRIDKLDSGSKKLYLKLSGSNQEYSYYRPSGDYQDLQESLSIGDEIKIYFNSSPKKDNAFIEIIQIEKGDLILIDHSEHKLKYLILLVTGILFTIYILYLAYRYFKTGKVENDIPPMF